MEKKNYYIWMLFLCPAFAFFIKLLLLGLGLFRFGFKFWEISLISAITRSLKIIVGRKRSKDTFPRFLIENQGITNNKYIFQFPFII